MKLNFSDERILAVVAHPDDAEILCAGTLARAQADGATIGICVFCQGDKGQPDPSIENLGDQRREEMYQAANILGAELYFGEIPDGTLADCPDSRQILLEHYRHFRPTLILSHSESDYHADHRAASAIAEAASWFSASRGHASRHKPLPEPPALWWMDTARTIDFQPEFYVDISNFIDTKHRMLACHHSQIQRGKNKDFAPLEEIMRSQYTIRGNQAGVLAAEGFRAHRAWKRARAW